MITALAAVLLGSPALAAAPPAVPPPAAAPAVRASTAPAAVPPAAAASALGVSTMTVSTLYTGDRVRDPFLPPSEGGGRSHAVDRNAPYAVDIHSLQLRGIMKDAKTDYALFATEIGTTLILRDGRLFDDRNKRVPGITGRIRIKQKRVELITADKDVQIFGLGESDEDKDQDGGADKQPGASDEP
jgi:hypothetical protein